MSQINKQAKPTLPEDAKEAELDRALQQMHADRQKRDSIGGSSIKDLGEGMDGVDWNPLLNVRRTSAAFLQLAPAVVPEESTGGFN